MYLILQSMKMYLVRKVFTDILKLVIKNYHKKRNKNIHDAFFENEQA